MKNEILVTKSNRCCPQCESQMSENCEYYGRIHYNGEMWYTSGCQHCACNSGRVLCMNVQCESTFCLKDEIMVKKKDECCISCRKPMYCAVPDGSGALVKENEFWMPNTVDYEQKKSTSSCKLCQCVEGRLQCYSKSCKTAKYPSYAHVSVYLNEKKEINARTIPFLADFIKTLRKDSLVFVSSGPTQSNLYIDESPVVVFNLKEIAQSKVYYMPSYVEQNEDDNDDEPRRNDFVTLSFVSSDNQTVNNVLIEFEIFKSRTDKENFDLAKLNRNDELSRTVKTLRIHAQDKITAAPRKTIFIHPGEAIKLTSAELKPKSLPRKSTNGDKLIYFLVSGNPKYGELKLKKVFSPGNMDEQAPLGWNKVNDIYLEKPVREFTQLDLDNGNVWYEPYNDFMLLIDQNTNMMSGRVPGEGCRNRTAKARQPCPYGENCAPGESDENYITVEADDYDDDCNEEFNGNTEQPTVYSNNGVDSSQQAKYDHCMFEVYDQDRLDELISKEIIHFSIQKEIINETVLGLEVSFTFHI